MPELSPRMQWPRPAANEDPWFDTFVSLVNASDASAFAAREDRNVILMGGGTITWDGSSLVWAATIEILSPTTGFLAQIPAGSLTLTDGQVGRITLPRGLGANTSIAVAAASFAANNDNSMLLCVRRGTRVYFRNGLLLNSGDSITNLGGTQGTGSTTLAGDVTGLSGANTVERIRNVPVHSAAPTAGQVLMYDTVDSRWEPTSAAGDVTGGLSTLVVAKLRGLLINPAISPSANDVLVWSGTQWIASPPTVAGAAVGGDLSGTLPNPTVAKVQGSPVQSGAPAVNDIWRWNGAQWTRVPHGSFPDGTNLAPSITFTADSNTGWWRNASGVVGFLGDGFEVVRFQAPTGASPQVLIANPSDLAHPTIGWASDTDTGILNATVGSATAGVMIVVGGVEGASVADYGSGIQLVGPAGSAAAAGVAVSDQDTGLYLVAANTLGLTAGGTERARFAATNSQLSTHWLPDADNTRNLGALATRWANAYAAVVQAGDGAVGTPSFTFGADPNTGAWRAGSGIIGVTGDGLEVVRFQAPAGANPQAIFADGSATNPSVAFATETGTGFLRNAAFSGIPAGGIRVVTAGQFAAYIGVQDNVGRVALDTGVGDRPSLCWSAQRNTGLYFPSTSRIGLALNAVQGFDFFRTPGNASGIETVFSVTPTISQTGTAGYSVVSANVTESTTGSGAKRFEHYQIASATKFALTTAGQLQSPESIVSYSFINETTTGIGCTAGSPATLDLYAENVLVAKVDNVSLYPATDLNRDLGKSTNQWAITYSTQFSAATGIAGSPGFVFTADTDTGIYLPSDGTLAISTAGSARVSVSSTEVSVGPPVRGPNGSASVPTYSFASSTNSGIAYLGISDSEVTLVEGGVAIACANSASGAFFPASDNGITLGMATFRWSMLHAVATTIGDLTMRNPDAKHGDRDAEHWKIVEGKDHLYAYNVRTGQKFRIAMELDDQDDVDRERIESDRQRFGWE